MVFKMWQKREFVHTHDLMPCTLLHTKIIHFLKHQNIELIHAKGAQGIL